MVLNWQLRTTSKNHFLIFSGRPHCSSTDRASSHAQATEEIILLYLIAIPTSFLLYYKRSFSNNPRCHPSYQRSFSDNQRRCHSNTTHLVHSINVVATPTEHYLLDAATAKEIILLLVTTSPSDTTTAKETLRQLRRIFSSGSKPCWFINTVGEYSPWRMLISIRSLTYSRVN